ncbi:hypothetical protein XENORESO_007049 [Xenotaenia resolanae]|uniref:Uncharacterized protein n=1 Tax=Xenotaenia resolanae TaxID=208358 RepID=A0ABV0W1L5_9TELE
MAPAELQMKKVAFSTASSIVGRREAGAYLQQSIGGRQDTPRGRATQRHTGQTTMHTLNVERPIYLTVMFLECGRKPEYPVRTHACTGRTPARESNPGPSCCKAAVLPTVPPCSPLQTTCSHWCNFDTLYIIYALA